MKIPRNWSKSLVLALATLVAGCGGAPSGPPPSKQTPQTPAGPKPVANPELQLELEVDPYAQATTYSMDMVYFLIRLRTRHPCEVAVPGPPHVQISLTNKASGEVVQARSNPLRPRRVSHLPLTLRPGESVELGPFGLDWLDVDPRKIHPAEEYRVAVEYLSKPGAKPIRVHQDLVLIPSKGLKFPYQSPLLLAPPVRAQAPVKLLDPARKLMREFYWSPDLGLAPPPDPTPEP